MIFREHACQCYHFIGKCGATSDVMFSVPVTCKRVEWAIVEGLKMSDFAKYKVWTTGKDLLEEKFLTQGK